ncbi:MAG: hypothetical protein GYA16_11940 [Spirochaetes bacterium]|nr:hypothetical protein [Spirochaetota bacterium]
MDNSFINSALRKIWKQSRFTSYFYHAVEFVQTQSIPTLSLVASQRMVLYYNPEFLNTISQDEFIGLLVHEMFHVILEHDHRAKTGDIVLQNIAQDMVVNTFISNHSKTFFSHKGQYQWDVPVLTIPQGLPFIPQEFYDETAIYDPVWEDVYRWLLQKQNDLKVIQHHGDIEKQKGMFHDDRYAIVHNNSQEHDNEFNYKNYLSHSSVDDDKLVLKDENSHLPTGVHYFAENNAHKRSVKNKIIAHAKKDEWCTVERSYLDIVALLEKINMCDSSYYENHIKSIIDYMSHSNEWYYTHSRFNRRYVAKGIYIAGRAYKQSEIITVAIDISASMMAQREDLETAFGIIEDLTGKYKVFLVCVDEEYFIPVKQGDTFIRSEPSAKPYEYKKGDWKLIKSGYGGATFFSSFFNEYLKGHKEMVLVITDGYIYDVDKLKPYPSTLWLITKSRNENFVPPFGKAISIV